MNPVLDFLNRLGVTWASLAWAVAWQSTLLAGIFSLFALWMRRSPPALRYWLWQIAAVKLLVMPLWVVSVALPVSPRHDPDARMAWTTTTPERAPTGRPTDRPALIDPNGPGGTRPDASARAQPWFVQVDWRTWLLLGWVLAVIGQMASVARQYGRLARLLCQAAPADDPFLLALVDELAYQMGLRKAPKVVIIDGVVSPFVCGLRSGLLVLPCGLTADLDPTQLRSVVLHELAHLRRRDLLWGWVPEAARVLSVLPPIAHYVASRVRLERELACDQVAMALSGQGAAAYATTLVQVVSRTSTPLTPRVALTSPGPIDV
jgi:hypothetical protein